MILPTAFSLPGIVREEKIDGVAGADAARSDARPRRCARARRAARPGCRSRAPAPCRAACARTDRGRGTAAGRRDSRIRARRAMTRSIARPITMTCRPLARPASAAARSRATLEAKVVTMTRPLALPTSLGEALGDIGLRRALALAQHVGRIADQREHALFAELAQPRLVGDAADQRRRVDLPVAGMDDEAGRGADRQRAALGDRMGDGDEFDVERPDVDPLALRDHLDRDLGRAGLAEAARLGEAGGEAGHVDVDAEPRPEFGERADMVLVGVGDDEADEVLLRLLDEGEVGHDEIDARQILAGEGEAEIDHQPFAALGRPEAVERAIHADFAETAERGEYQLAVIGHSVRLSCDGLGGGDGSRAGAVEGSG